MSSLRRCDFGRNVQRQDAESTPRLCRTSEAIKGRYDEITCAVRRFGHLMFEGVAIKPCRDNRLYDLLFMAKRFAAGPITDQSVAMHQLNDCVRRYIQIRNRRLASLNPTPKLLPECVRTNRPYALPSDLLYAQRPAARRRPVGIDSVGGLLITHIPSESLN